MGKTRDDQRSLRVDEGVGDVGRCAPSHQERQWVMSKSWNEVGAKSMVAVLAERDSRITSLESQLAEAKEKVAELEMVLHSARECRQYAEDGYREIKEENRRLREAMKWYADPKNYPHPDCCIDDLNCEAIGDSGALARSALTNGNEGDARRKQKPKKMR